MFLIYIQWSNLQFMNLLAACGTINFSSEQYLINNAKYQHSAMLLLPFLLSWWVYKPVGRDASRENTLLKNSYEAKNNDPWDMYIINLGVNPLKTFIKGTSKNKCHHANYMGIKLLRQNS
jgi:hypothetical protein